jgi:hypothetical protein
MRSKPRVWLSVFLFAFFCALIPSGRLFAQQMTGAQGSSNAIDQLTGPIALYPDALVFQIMTASTSVDKVKSFAGWMGKNANLKGGELQDAAEKAGFDAAYVALAPFPQVIQMMAQKPDWTKALGQAFTADEKAIFDSIQRLRSQAQAAGNLKTTSEQQVATQTTSSGQQVIVIQPTNPQVIYVPTYNPQTVYVAAPPPPSGASVAGATAIGFTAGAIIGASRNSYYRRYDDYWDHREDYAHERQENYQKNASQRQSSAQANQSQRQSTAQATQSQRQSAAATSSRGGGQTASGYQSGSATRAQSSRGSASLSSSRGSRGGGGRRRG